ncbi:hypothetical protein SteCoe_3286 [Stentor coeruleus]|uniref:Uncharacterized protein n=1 Tax=Stentor coeruleus TaxID=5963 RepID=A0A1R2CXL6_9CILI|nr:hypothetical protein SteCoe_3286 [Stentor coeruleus]
MTGLEKFQSCDIIYRISNASTEDFAFSSDDDNDLKAEPCFLRPEDAASLFIPISPSREEYYHSLEQSLENIYCKLDDEIQPVNIRDELTHHAADVKLNTVGSSLISRRRSNILNKL